MSDKKDEVEKKLAGDQKPSVSVEIEPSPEETPQETAGIPQKAPIKLTTDTPGIQPGQQPMQFKTTSVAPTEEAQEEKEASKEVKTKPEMEKVGYESFLDMVKSWEEWFKALFMNLGHMIKAAVDYKKYRDEMKEFNKTTGEPSDQTPPTLGGNAAAPPSLGGPSGSLPTHAPSSLGEMAQAASRAAEQHAVSGSNVPPNPEQVPGEPKVTPGANAAAQTAQQEAQVSRQQREAEKKAEFESKPTEPKPPSRSTPRSGAGG